MSNPTELLNCPFCGGTPDLLLDEDNCSYVSCEPCSVAMPAYRPGFEQNAIQAWNRRAQPEGDMGYPISVSQPEGEAPQAEELVHALRQAERLLRAGGFAMTGTASSQIVTAIAAHAAAAQQAAAPGALALLNTGELAALRRFYETCQDGEGYDVPKAMMQRLAEIGVVRRTSGSYYETTEFGLRVLHQPAPSAPGTPEAPKGGA